MSNTVGGTLWVCQDCMISAVNGEVPVDPDPTQPEPWAVETDTDVAPGLMREEHDDDCDPDEQCECETRSFSWSSCDGCGSTLGGERHAFTWWED